MSSINKKESLSVSLFPIFNILICTLGVLIFIMTTVSVLSLRTANVPLNITYYKTAGPEKKTPHYLVWDGSTIVLPEKKDTVFLEYDVSKMKTYKKSHDYIKRKIKGTEIGELFDSIKKNSRQQYFVVFVRAKGFAGFADLKNFIKTEGIDIGYDPVNNDSPIKL